MQPSKRGMFLLSVGGGGPFQRASLVSSIIASIPAVSRLHTAARSHIGLVHVRSLKGVSDLALVTRGGEAKLGTEVGTMAVQSAGQSRPPLLHLALGRKKPGSEIKVVQKYSLLYTNTVVSNSKKIAQYQAHFRSSCLFCLSLLPAVPTVVIMLIIRIHHNPG